MSAAPVPKGSSYIADCSYHPTITHDPKTPREQYLFNLAGLYGIEDVRGTAMYDGASVVIVDKPHKPPCAECVYGRMCIAGKCRKKNDENDEWQSCGGAPIFLKRQFISTPWEPVYEADADQEVYDHSLCTGDDCEAMWACYTCGGPMTIEKDALPGTVVPPIFCFARLTDTITHVTRPCLCEGGCGMELFSVVTCSGSTDARAPRQAHAPPRRSAYPRSSRCATASASRHGRTAAPSCRGNWTRCTLLPTKWRVTRTTCLRTGAPRSRRPRLELHRWRPTCATTAKGSGCYTVLQPECVPECSGNSACDDI